MKEARSFRVEAIVLRHTDWGEADRMLTLYTHARGKLRAIAKSARKIRSRKAGRLEPFQPLPHACRARSSKSATCSSPAHSFI